MLQELRRRGKAVGIVTNGVSTVQEGTIDALAIRSLLDAILVSEVEGVRKPRPEIFRRAASRVGVRPRDCCYVGDHPEIDVAGAAEAGFYALWKRTPHWASPPADIPTIESLTDVLSHV